MPLIIQTEEHREHLILVYVKSVIKKPNVSLNLTIEAKVEVEVGDRGEKIDEHIYAAGYVVGLGSMQLNSEPSIEETDSGFIFTFEN